jgi:hypothetical protein
MEGPAIGRPTNSFAVLTYTHQDARVKAMATARRKTTVYLDEDVLRASRVLAARTGQHEYEIVNAALRSFLGLAAVERVWGRSQLSEEQAAALAYGELRAMRRDRGGDTPR